MLFQCFLNENFMNYLNDWNEKYYKNGFCYEMELMTESLNAMSV